MPRLTQTFSENDVPVMLPHGGIDVWWKQKSLPIAVP